MTDQSYASALFSGEPALRGSTRYSCEEPTPCACGWGLGHEECICEETRLYCATCGGDWDTHAIRVPFEGGWILRTRDEECCPHCGSDVFSEDAPSDELGESAA